MEERRLGPVVGLGTWNTFDRDERAAREPRVAIEGPPGAEADDRPEPALLHHGTNLRASSPAANAT